MIYAKSFSFKQVNWKWLTGWHLNLMDFTDLDENADERKVESEIVGNIKEFKPA